MDRFIIPVSGVPGTGKSAIARILSQELECVFLEFSTYLIEGGYTERDPSGRRTLLIREEGLRSALRSLSEFKARCLILASLFPAVTVEELDNLIPFIVLLRCSPLELMRRLEARAWPRGKVIENVLAEAFNSLAEELVGYEHYVIEVDTTGRTAPEAFTFLWDKLVAWDTGIAIDWMSDPRVQDLVSSLVMDRDFEEYRLGV